MDEATQRALDIAAALIDAGVPVFAAPPCPASEAGGSGVCTRPGHEGGAVEFDLPPKWQFTVASKVWLDRWRPGWALAAVGGHVCDFLDEDPRNGGEASLELLEQAGMPRVFGVAQTPSGGRHYLISPLGERKAVGFLPGLDYQGGAPDGRGRGFVWIAPTVKRSKTDGVARAYVWTQEPDMDFLAEFNGDGFTDDSSEILRETLHAKKNERVGEVARPSGVRREFTWETAQAFIEGSALSRVRTASIGEIEETANAAACTLSHFVPSMLSADQAYDLLTDALGETAYDPNHLASTWTAEKFHDVISGQVGRAPGDWIAVHIPESLEEALEAGVPADEVSALLAEMLPPSAAAQRLPPRYMVKGLLTYDSAAWLIGGPGSKKSFVALDLAAHVALGLPWQGRRVNKGIVVIIAGEGAGSIGKRIQAWEKEHGPMPDDAIRILPRPVQAGKPEKWAVLVEACRRLRVVTDESVGIFVIVDTQARSTVGIEENSAKEMGLYVDAVDSIKAVTKGCVLSVHHTGKVGGGTRGSSALDGAQDTRLKMEAVAGTLDAKLTVAKQKDLEEDAPILLRFKKVDVGVDADGEPMDSLVLMEHDAWRSSESGVFAGGPQGLEDVQHMISEPHAWTYVPFPDAQSKLARQILQAVAVSGQVGRTEVQIRDLVVERWYPAGLGRKEGQLPPGAVGRGGWAHAWSRCVEVQVDGEPMMHHPEGSAARWGINPIAEELCQHRQPS